MAVLYRLQEIKNSQDNTSKWVARTQMTNTVGLEDLAKRIERNCTAKRSDVMAVLTELVEVMTDELENSHAVKLNGFGTFRVGISGKSVTKPEEFDINKNVRNIHLNFFPEIYGSCVKGQKRKHVFIENVKMKLFDPAAAKEQ